MQSLSLAAIDLFERAQAQGWWYRLWAALRGRPSQLLDLRSVASGLSIRARRSAGTQIVPVRQILGSEGRGDDFDSAFHPIQTHTEARWRGIARAWLAGAEMPPVDLIQIGDVYFVRDGHHRISVARALGQQEIDAVVTVWQVERAEAKAQIKHPVFSIHEGGRPLGQAHEDRRHMRLSNLRRLRGFGISDRRSCPPAPIDTGGACGACGVAG